MKRSALVVSLLVLCCTAPAAASTPTRYVDEVFDRTSVTRDVVYGRSRTVAGVEQDLLLDLYAPTGDRAKERAVFIWAHGGGFTAGDKADIAAGPVSIKDSMTRRGWVTISINYRLDPTLPGGGIPGYVGTGAEGVQSAIRAVRDAQHDMQAAVRWVRAKAKRYRLDPDRIAIGGHSAGATTAMAVAFNSDDPGASGNPGFPSDVHAAIGTGTGNAPLVDVHPDPLVEPPIGMFHGQNDSLMPFAVPLATCLVSQAMLNVCEFRTYEGQGHDQRVGMPDWPDFLHTYAIEQVRPPYAQRPGTLPTIPRLP